MPLNRYQIKNELSLGDPELYKVADKDDPEALLEGVAMAALVGVLRQLGDLAEFASEIFHDLHEEVMSTAARGHNLIVRVQQLEGEFPSVERTLLSQTSHTALLYNSGVDWHSNPRMDQNLVTQGDLPRFVMDSYEDCRGPPRLFLLDKFDVAGAGACLKRFTDPSFFQAESTFSTGGNSRQREKKMRRGKKRGSRWRNGDTPETFPSSKAKLHQLFLEESIESGGSDPQRRVKLKKKQLAGSLFDHDKGQSYMEKILDTCPPKRDFVHEICIDPLPLTWRSENGCESGLEIVEISTFSPLKEPVETNRSAGSSPSNMDMVMRPSMDDFIEDKWNKVIASEAMRVTCFNHERDSDERDAGKFSSKAPKAMNSEELTNGESKSEFIADDCQNSDDSISEIDNYMDALATIESEVETDSECNKNAHYLNLKPIVVDSDPSEAGKRELQSFDAQSVGNSITSEDSSIFFKERYSASASCSVSVDSLAETTLDHDKMSIDHHPIYEAIPGNRFEDHTVRSTVVDDDYGGSKNLQDFGEASNNSSLTYQNRHRSNLDEVYSTFANHNHTYRITDQEHVSDALEMRDSVHLTNEECPTRDPTATSDGALDLRQKELKNVDSDASSCEKHSIDCSEVTPSFTYQPVTDSSYPESVVPINLASKSINGALSADLHTVSVEGHSANQSHVLDSKQEANVQEHYSEAINCGPTAPSDLIAAEVNSQEESNFKGASADVLSNNESSPASIIDQSDMLPSISDRPDVGASLSSFEILSSVESGAVKRLSPGDEPNNKSIYRSADSEMDDLSMIGKLSPAVDPSEIQDQWLENPKKADTDPLEYDLAKVGGDECKDALKMAEFASDAGCLDVTHLNQLDQFETDEHLKCSENPVQDYATGDYFQKQDDKDEALAHGLPSTLPIKLAVNHSSASAAENSLNSYSSMENMESREADAIGSRQIDPDGYPHKSVLVISSSPFCSDKVQEQPSSVTEECHQNEEESLLCPAVELMTLKHVDSPDYSTSSTCNIAEDVLCDENGQNCNVSDHKGPIESTSCQINLLDGKEDNVDSLIHNELKPMIFSEDRKYSLEGESEVQPFHAGESSSQSVDYAKQIEALVYVDREASFNTPPQSVGLTPEHSSQSMVKATEIFLGNDTLTGQDQAIQEAGNCGQLVYPQGFPAFGMVPAEPQLNVDSPPLPPLPPMQWRLSKLQNPFAASQRQMHQHIVGLVQPMPATVSEIVSEDDRNIIGREDELSSTTPTSLTLQNELRDLANGHAAQQEAVNLPMLHDASTKSEGLVLQCTTGSSKSSSTTNADTLSVYYQNGSRTEENLSFSPSSKPASSHYGNHVSAEDYVAQEVHTAPMLSSISEVTCLDKTEDSLSFSDHITSTSSHCGTQVPEDGYVVQEVHTMRKVSSASQVTSLDKTEYNMSFTATPSTSTIFYDGTQVPADDYVAHEVHAMPRFSSVTEITSLDKTEANLSLSTPSTSASSHYGIQVPENDFVAQEVHSMPKLSSVSEITSLNKMNGISKDDMSLTTPTSTASEIGNRDLEESHLPGLNLHEHRSLADLSTEHEPKIVEAKVNADIGVQDEQHRHIPRAMRQEEMNTHVHYFPPSTQPLPGFVAPVAGITWSSTYDGVPNNADGLADGTLQKKPPRPRNPLIDEVVAIDKSKLRKVERVKPPMEEKLERGESLLEHMQLRKVERVKPSVERKTDEVLSLLGKLQLRKVGERVKAPVEQIAEEKECLLEQVQLRKVGERVKLQVKQTTEETESLRVSLRKVGEMVKSDVEKKPAETESPRVQLRRVEDQKPEIEQKPEETESPQVQLRKIGDRTKAQVEQKPEETESPRVQLRKIGARAHPPVQSKSEDRDSLFEQIRNKSFNLKPADVARPMIQVPSVQGPRTNLKVAAIIEKASNIRQAMVGSDEEDDTDTWSDC